MKRKSLEVTAIGLALAAAAASAAGENLLQVYRDAQRYDATYAAARFTLEAGRERLPQARAGLLPSLNLTANTMRSNIDSDSRSPAFDYSRSPTSAGYELRLTQPLYRPQNLADFNSADYQVKQAEATFAQATQDLVVRVVQAYLEVLAAQDNLTLVGAQKAAIAEQLAQAKRNFEVGTTTITDTHEAQSRYDLTVSQEIAAQNELSNRRQSLQLITGKEYARLATLRADVRIPPPNPDQMQAWVELAEKQSYVVLIQEAAAEAAQIAVRRASSGHLPTLDVVATHAQVTESSTVANSIGRDVTTSTLGLQLAVPLFQGGSLTSREREAAANYNKAREDLQNARRTAALVARQSYVSVINGISQIGALEQALISSQSALDSNRLGYEVGVRINIDVLNAQQQLFTTRRDLFLARYNLINSHLRLRAAAGSLRDEDIEAFNRALDL